MTALQLVRTESLEAAPARPDQEVIARLIEPNTRVLDVGCGDGAMLALLQGRARARGIERDGACVRACVARGLAVVQGDAEQDLAEFPAQSFDYVVLSHVFQGLAQPREALRQARRIGAHVIISIENGAHWRVRTRLALQGRAGEAWADGQAARPCGVRDLAELARGERLTLERAIPLSNGRPGAPFARRLWRANWFADEAVFLFVA